MFIMNDPDTFWLTTTNIALGVVTLICCAVVAAAVVQEVAVRMKRARAIKALAADNHAFVVTDLGLTMADGGEPVAGKSSTAPSPEKSPLPTIHQSGEPDERNIIRSDN